MGRNNVLITSAGRRVALVRAFQEALHPRGSRVVATDVKPQESAACHVADSRRSVPRNDDPSYVDETLRVAIEHEVGLVIPTLDSELLALSEARPAFAERGVQIAVSDHPFIQSCRNKRRTARVFETLGVSPIREVKNTFPRFVKPVDGSLSTDVHFVHDREALPRRLEDRDRFVHQELIDRSRYREYSIDALYSDNGVLLCAVPRLRIEVRGGEISKGRTSKGPILDLFKEHFAQMPGARGCLTIQLFFNPDDADRPMIGIEINPRFGGGYPMSHSARADFSGMLIAEHMDGARLSYREDWTAGITFLRFDEHVAVPS